MALRSKGSKNKSGRSRTGRLGTVPNAPTIGTATDVGTNRPYDNGAITITFTPSSEGTPATSYTASAYCSMHNTTHTASGNSSPLTITGFGSGVNTTVTVVATNQYGNSAASSASNSVTVTTVPATPSAPSASSPSAGTDAVSWSAPANGGKAITNYYWTSSDGKSGNTGSTSVNVAQEQGTAQTYNVRADNANGSSSTSANSGSVTTTFSFAPFSVFGFSPFGVFGFSPFGFSPFGFSPFGFSPFGFSPFGFSPFGFSPFGFSPFSPSVKGVSLFGETKVRTPNGLVAAAALSVGDEIYSVVLPGLPETGWTPEQVIAWTSDPNNMDMSNLVTTTIQEIVSGITDLVVFINGDAFSGPHGIMVKRDDIAKFVQAKDVVETDMVWSWATSQWMPITSLDKYEIAHQVWSINTEPYDVFFTENMLVHDTRPDAQ